MYKILTPLGHALPPAPRHAITTHAPTWQNALRFRDADPELMKSFKNMYPRMMIHTDIKELSEKILAFIGAANHGCLLFPSMEAAANCKAFAVSPSRGDGMIPSKKISVRVFHVHVSLYAVVFPQAFLDTVHLFWTHAGVGISSRLAEECLKQLASLREAAYEHSRTNPVVSPAHLEVKTRIAWLMERASITPLRTAKVTPDDVYLFQTGMSAIYWIHEYLLKKHNSHSVLFGFAFHSTIHILEDIGPGTEFLGLGNTDDLDKLELRLSLQAKQGEKTQAIWVEFPSNPLLVTPDLARLRKISDKFGVLLIVDDTISSFCNVDVLAVADIVVTSLTKSFSGYADVTGGSAVISPSSTRYAELKNLFSQRYQNDLYAADAEVLARNSRDYLPRSAIMNNNAVRLVAYLQSCAKNPASSIIRVYHPSVSDSLPHYRKFMRSSTLDVEPSFGCVFSVEFDTIEATIAFYDNLSVHQGPHLGAHLTLAIAYCMILYGSQLDWAARYNMRPTQIRISVGLEERRMLLGVFRSAVEAADAANDGHRKSRSLSLSAGRSTISS